MNDECGYIVIQRWMLIEMQLKGNELLAYALIYGFSQTTGTAFTGSLSYIGSWLQTDKANALRVMKSLLAKGYIKREDFEMNGVKYVSYSAVLPWDEGKADRCHDDNPVVKTTTPVVKSRSQNDNGRCQKGVVKMTTNNILDNIYNIPPVTTNVVTSPKGERTSANDEKETAESKSRKSRTPSLAGPPEGNPSPDIPRAPSPCDERFEQFWTVYPRKVGKGAARKAFAKIKPSEELLKRMVTAVIVQSKTEMWTKDKGQYIPNPATWLNQERWEDEINPTDNKPPKGPMTDDEWKRNGW